VTQKIKLAGLLLCATLVPAQKTVKRDIKFDDPRVERASEKRMVVLYVCDLQGVEVTFPKDELVRQAAVGDSTNWVVTSVPEDRRDLTITPREPITSQTILNVTSNHDNRYVFRLVLNDGHCDSHVTLEADRDLQQKINSVPAWVSPETYQAALKAADEAKQKAAEAEQKAAQAAQSASGAEDKFRSEYPAKMVFDYEYDRKLAAKLGVEAVYHDDRFTYAKVNSGEPPVLCELKDGKPSAIQFELRDGVYRTARIIDEGYLVRGGSGNGKHQERLVIKRNPNLAITGLAAVSGPDGAR
jgi:type IV secretion system protein VirB9